MNYRFRPIDVWPRTPTQCPQVGPFTTTAYSSTLKLLEYELEKLGVDEAVIQVALAPQHIRQDGLPRAGAPQPRIPGVIVSFESRHGPLSFACDTYQDWRSNLRGIAVTLEALRALDRYGVTKSGEQYRGFPALPAPAPGFTTLKQALIFVLAHSQQAASPQQVQEDPASYSRHYRSAIRKLHPDAGGNAEKFQRLQEADRLIRKELGL